MHKPVVGVVFGSRSTEHDVSVITALASVITPLELSGKYRVLPVYIAKDGRWYANEELKDIGLYSSGKINSWLKRHRPVELSVGQGLRLISKGFRTKTTAIDIAFPALHGTHGEDGQAMGIFEMAGIPYVGCDVAASAVAMDKVLTKLVVEASGISTAAFQHFTKYEFEQDPAEWITRINRNLHYPLFVKPAHLGSSIGITRVTDPAELQNAIEVAIHYDDRAVVEEAVPNLIEVTLPIMGNDQPRPALLEQPTVSSQDFFDFDTKYMAGGKKGGGSQLGGALNGVGAKGAQGYSQIPADLPANLYKQAVETGLAVYKALGCSGLARVDMLIDSKLGKVYCNEVNPLPGSLYAHNWNRAGVSNVDLVTSLVDLAIERHEHKRKLKTSFSTNFLKQF